MYIYLTTEQSKLEEYNPQTGELYAIHQVSAPLTKAWLETLQTSIESFSISINQHQGFILYLNSNSIIGVDAAPFIEDIQQNVLDELSDIISNL